MKIKQLLSTTTLFIITLNLYAYDVVVHNNTNQIYRRIGLMMNCQGCYIGHAEADIIASIHPGEFVWPFPNQYRYLPQVSSSTNGKFIVDIQVVAEPFNGYLQTYRSQFIVPESSVIKDYQSLGKSRGIDCLGLSFDITLSENENTTRIHRLM